MFTVTYTVYVGEPESEKILNEAKNQNTRNLLLSLYNSLYENAEVCTTLNFLCATSPCTLLNELLMSLTRTVGMCAA